MKRHVNIRRILYYSPGLAALCLLIAGCATQTVNTPAAPPNTAQAPAPATTAAPAPTMAAAPAPEPTTTAPAPNGAAVTPASATAAVPQSFQPYVVVKQPPPKPKHVVHAHRKLHLVQHSDQYYLADDYGHDYYAARDEHGDLYPAYRDPDSGQTLPLYYDPARDRYFRCAEDDDGHFYRGYVGDPNDRYYPDYGGSYADFHSYPPDDYRPEIVAPHHSGNRDAWLLAIPVVVAAYFLLQPHHHHTPPNVQPHTVIWSQAPRPVQPAPVYVQQTQIVNVYQQSPGVRPGQPGYPAGQGYRAPFNRAAPQRPGQPGVVAASAPAFARSGGRPGVPAARPLPGVASATRQVGLPPSPPPAIRPVVLPGHPPRAAASAAQPVAPHSSFARPAAVPHTAAPAHPFARPMPGRAVTHAVPLATHAAPPHPVAVMHPAASRVVGIHPAAPRPAVTRAIAHPAPRAVVIPARPAVHRAPPPVAHPASRAVARPLSAHPLPARPALRPTPPPVIRRVVLPAHPPRAAAPAAHPALPHPAIAHPTAAPHPAPPPQKHKPNGNGNVNQQGNKSG